MVRCTICGVESTGLVACPNCGEASWLPTVEEIGKFSSGSEYDEPASRPKKRGRAKRRQ